MDLWGPGLKTNLGAYKSFMQGSAAKLTCGNLLHSLFSPTGRAELQANIKKYTVLKYKPNLQVDSCGHWDKVMYITKM